MTAPIVRASVCTDVEKHGGDDDDAVCDFKIGTKRLRAAAASSEPLHQPPSFRLLDVIPPPLVSLIGALVYGADHDCTSLSRWIRTCSATAAPFSDVETLRRYIKRYTAVRRQDRIHAPLLTVVVTAAARGGALAGNVRASFKSTRQAAACAHLPLDVWLAL